MKLKDILKDIKTTHPPDIMGKEISGIAYNSQRVNKGSLFVALRGAHNDGHSFLRDAMDRGATLCIVEKKDPSIPAQSQIIVENTRKALGVLARNFYKNPTARLKVFGITGTKGKTSTSFILKKILEESGAASGLIGTIHYQIGERTIASHNTTPESADIQQMCAEMVEKNLSHAILEVSSHALAQGRVAEVSFDYAIFTNASSHEHLDYHKTYKEYLATKRSLFTNILAKSEKEPKYAIINLDDPEGAHFAEAARAEGCKVRTFGIHSRGNVHPEQVKFLETKTLFTIEGVQFSTPLLGPGNLSNSLAAIAAAQCEKIENTLISQALETIPQIPGRMEFVPIPQDFKVVVDYAHTHHSLLALLATARKFSSKRVILVFGCGGDRDPSKRALMGSIAAKEAHLVFITSDNPRNENPLAIIGEIWEGIPFWRRKRCRIVPDRKEAILQAITIAEKGDWVVIAGKGHEDYQIIHNVHYPFDDRIIAQEAAIKRAKNNG